MSRSRRHVCCEKESGYGFLGNCCCSFPTLVILILILLQFNRGYGGYGAAGAIAGAPGAVAGVGAGYGGGSGLVDNGILFIIALFYLACCNPCGRGFGGFGGGCN